MPDDQNPTPDRVTPQGKTLTAQGPKSQPVPRMPHEHDESADSQATSEPSSQRMGALAHDDLERGLVDTDKGPVLEQTYEKVRAGTPAPRK